MLLCSVPIENFYAFGAKFAINRGTGRALIVIALHSETFPETPMPSPFSNGNASAGPSPEAYSHVDVRASGRWNHTGSRNCI